MIFELWKLLGLDLGSRKAMKIGTNHRLVGFITLIKVSGK